MEINLVMTLWYALWGLVVGLMVGFTAIGTGLLGGPGLILFFGLNPVMASGTIALSGVLMMSSGLVQHFRQKNVEWRFTLLFSITAVPIASITAILADEINEIIPLKLIIGGVIILSTGLLFYRYIIMKEPSRDLEIPRWKMIAAPFIGLVMGVIMGATSISGSIILLVLLLVIQLPPNLAVGTTSCVAAVSLAAASIAHITDHHVDWNAFLGLVPGVITGAWIGSLLVNRVPRNILRFAILVILLAAGIMVFFK